jgi:hypothetical protein
MGGIEERGELVHAHLVFFFYQSGNALTALMRLHVAGHPFIIPSFNQIKLTIWSFWIEYDHCLRCIPARFRPIVNDRCVVGVHSRLIKRLQRSRCPITNRPFGRCEEHWRKFN